MTPQTITEIDTLLGNKPHSKKELRAWIDANMSDRWCFYFREYDTKKKKDIGKHRFFSFFFLRCILNDLHVLGNITLPVWSLNYIKKRRRNSRSCIAHGLTGSLCLSKETETGWKIFSSRRSRFWTLVNLMYLKWKKEEEKNASVLKNETLKCEWCFSSDVSLSSSSVCLTPAAGEVEGQRLCVSGLTFPHGVHVMLRHARCFTGLGTACKVVCSEKRKKEKCLKHLFYYFESNQIVWELFYTCWNENGTNYSIRILKKKWTDCTATV